MQSLFDFKKDWFVLTEVDPKGQSRSYSYNELNQMVQAQFPDDVVISTYDINGEIESTKNNVSQINFTRDTRKRVTGVEALGLGAMSNYPGLLAQYAYDSNDNKISMQSSVQSIGYAYDNLNRLTEIQTSSGSQFNYAYDSLGRLASLVRPAGRTDYTYLGQQLSNIIHSSGGNTKSFAEYTYDDRNYPVSKRSPAGLVSYAYDLTGQLKVASGTNANESFNYDPLGNRILDQNGNYIYDQSTQRLTEDWQYHYSYDANGNLSQKIPKDLNKNAWVYSYSSRNQLTRVQQLASSLGQVLRQVDYQYDVLGRRIQKSVWTKDFENDPKKTYQRKYVYDGDNVLAEYDTNNNLIAKYTHSPMMADDILETEITTSGVQAGIAQVSGKFYYLKDALGSISDIANDDGNIVQRYDYESYGKIKSIKKADETDITQSPTLNTSYTYTGREWDEEADLYYYRARYYDAAVGRFLQKDPHPGSLQSPMSLVNAYTFVHNRPTNLSDPSGKFAIVVPMLIAAAVGGIIGGYSAEKSGGNFWMGFGNGAFIGAGSVLATAAGAGLVTGALKLLSIKTAAGSIAGILGGVIGGALGNGIFFGALGARGTDLAIAVLSGGLSGGLLGSVGKNWGQTSSLEVSEVGKKAVEAVDTYNRAITPVNIPFDMTKYINDKYFIRPDGSWSNGAAPPSGPSLVMP